MNNPDFSSSLMRCRPAPILSVLGWSIAAMALGAMPVGRLAAQLPSETAFRAAADYSAQQQGLAVLVLHKGKIVYERYERGHKAETSHHIFSGTKSFAPMVALIAQKEGLLELDELVSKTLPEWARDERKNKITIRHLLSFTSGLSQRGSFGAPDLYQLAIDAKAETEPGKRFRYGSNHLRVFGAVLARKLAAAGDQKATSNKKPAADFVSYLEDRILNPIGMKYTFWMRDRKRHPTLSYGCFVTAREWAKFGQLIGQKGKWGERQIIPAEHLDECFVGTKAGPWYGLNWWLIGPGLHKRRPRIPKDAVAAKGMYHQLLYVIPSTDLVIVRFGKHRVRVAFSDAEFLGRLLRKEPGSRPGTETRTGSGKQEPAVDGTPGPAKKPVKKRRKG